MLFWISILLPLCQALAIAPSSPVSLIYPSSNVSSALGLSDSLDSQCVSPGRYNAWNGRIVYDDCQRTLSELRRETASVANELFAFYTTAGGYHPPRGPKELEWPLPTTVTSGTCQIQVRMFRDFEPAEVPTSNGRYIVPSECAPQSITTWAAILREAEGALRCVRYGWPGWGSEGLRSKRQRPKEFGDIGVFIWGVTSQIAHDYDARGHLTAAGENRNMSTVETA